MFLHIKRQLLADGLGVDREGYPFFPFCEQLQYRIINIIINKDNGGFGFSYQIGDEGISIEDLVVVENIRKTAAFS